MQVYDGTLGAKERLLSENSRVIILSNNGQHAHVIVEQDGPIVRVYLPEDRQFADKAKSYGFEMPGVSQLENRFA